MRPCSARLRDRALSAIGAALSGCAAFELENHRAAYRSIAGIACRPCPATATAQTAIVKCEWDDGATTYEITSEQWRQWNDRQWSWETISCAEVGFQIVALNENRAEYQTIPSNARSRLTTLNMHGQSSERLAGAIPAF